MIQVTSELPEINSPVVIDGATQPGFNGQPLIELRGSGGRGLTIRSGGSTVRSLVINSFPGDAAIRLLDGDGNTIQGNYFGTEVPAFSVCRIVR